MESSRGDREISRETSELLKTPEQVFDSDKEKADAQAAEVAKRIMEGRDIRYERSGLSVLVEGKKVETGVVSKKSIKIAWPRNNQHTTMLQLDPITEGYCAEADVLAYTGRYGVAKKVKEEWEFLDRDSAKSLEEAFCVPDGKHLLVKPTIDRWAIGKDELSAAYSEDTYTLHMGLGFLLLGEPWMYIGMHEGGHMPDNHDENLA